VQDELLLQHNIINMKRKYFRTQVGIYIFRSISFVIIITLEILVQQNQLDNTAALEEKSTLRLKSDWEFKGELTSIEYATKRRLDGGLINNIRPERNNSSRLYDN